MDWKLVLLILSIFIIFVIFYRNLKQGCPKKEGYEDKGDSKEVQMSVERKLICDKNKYDDTGSFPLREYLIKGCFNSAYNGSNVSAEVIQTRLSEGYRFLDFNVFCASGGIVYVGFSKDNAPVMGDATLKFEDALSTVAAYAFKSQPISSSATSATSANAGPSLRTNYINYPVWVHIRVYRPPNSETDVIGKVAELIQNAQIPGNLFLTNAKGKPTQITGCTSLKSIGPKIIFSVDIENVRQVYQPSDTLSTEWTPVATREAIRKFANVLTGGSTIPAFYRYKDKSISRNTKKLGPSDGPKGKTNAKYWYIVFPHPDDTRENPDATKFVLQNTIQLIPMRVYLGGDNLRKYNEIFESLKTPFAPLTHVYTHLNA